MDYKEQLKDGRWQQKRLRIFQRDLFACLDTNQKDNLQVHHCWYAKGPAWNTPDEYLITVTGESHKKRHRLEADLRRSLGRIFAACTIEELRALRDQAAMIAAKFSEKEAFASENAPYLIEQTEAVAAYFHLLETEGQK